MSRTRNRRLKKRLDRFSARTDAERAEQIDRHLRAWSGEIQHIAWNDGAAAARDFAENPDLIAAAHTLDTSGTLEANLRRFLIDAEAEATGYRLGRGRSRR